MSFYTKHQLEGKLADEQVANKKLQDELVKTRNTLILAQMDLVKRGNKSIIYLDMDGVLADFDAKGLELFGSTWKEEIKLPEWGRFSAYPSIYEMLAPMPDALELYEGCCQFTGDRNQVQILTALPRRARLQFPDAVQHKVEWARKHIHPQIRVRFGPFAMDKQYHCYSPQDVLIDDMQINIDQWNNIGGIGILHTSAQQSLQQLRAARC